MTTRKRPLILLSNDDGVYAKGIGELMDALLPVADLVVVAPDGARSGASCSITTSAPLHCRLVEDGPELKIYVCNGTPVDCVKLGLSQVLTRRPDLVVGGINHGDNSSVNVHYSGTMGIVTEGCLKGVPSIGFSLCSYDADADFSATHQYIRLITERVLEHGLPHGICLNVNFPDTRDIRGVKICRQTFGVWVNEFYRARHPRGGEYYWMTGDYENLEPGVEGTDQWALEHGYVAVTPTQIDVTAYSLMDELKSWGL